MHDISLTRRGFLFSSSLAIGAGLIAGLEGCSPIINKTRRMFSAIPSYEAIHEAASVLSPVNPSQLKAYPLFSWDRVPVAAHLGKPEGDFTHDELQFLANRFPLITIEKMQAKDLYHVSEPGTYKALQQLKDINSDLKILFYWNSVVAYPFYQSYETFREHPQWAMKNVSGWNVLDHREFDTYDLSNPHCREWWIKVACEAIHQHGFDGLFIDEVSSLYHSEGRSRQWGSAKYNEVMKGMAQLLLQVHDCAGDEKLLIFNGLHADSEVWDDCGISFLQLLSGAMVEHFGSSDLLEREGANSKYLMAAYIAAIQEAGKRGRILLVKGWPGFNWRNPISKSYDVNAAAARSAIKFPLACFLVAAEPYSYFIYSWGYTDKEGTLIPYPEFDKPLGPPKGPGIRNGWIYTREFEHARVEVDLDLQQANIDWKA
jgi:hypothetical protein